MAQGVMTGTGTETDPYLIEDCYDFLTMNDTTTYGGGNYFKLVENIDFNEHETYRFGFDDVTVVNRAVNLDGNNKTIYNIILKNYTTKSWAIFGGTNLLKDCNIANLIMINCEVTGTYGWMLVSMQNCNIGVSLHNSTTTQLFGGISMTDCTVNIKGFVPNYITLHNTGIYERCHINVDILATIGSNKYVIYMMGKQFNNSRITGRVKNVGNSGLGGFIYTGGNIDNSYIALEYEGGVCTTDICYNTLTVSTCFFIDKDLLGNLTLSGSETNTHLLTTEQCKDISYLQEIGFLAF